MDHADFEDLLENFTEGHLHIVTDMDALMLFDHSNGIMMEPLEQDQYEQMLRSLDSITYIGDTTDERFDHLYAVVGSNSNVLTPKVGDAELLEDVDDTFTVMAAIKLRNGDVNYFCVQYYDSDDS